ncbi:MAG: hypothetical protein ACKPKO_47200, partial [Candidatus Fonsibacter sp.]
MALYLPSAFGRVGKRGKLGKADEMYEEFISIYQDTNVEQRERLTGIKMSYQLRVVLFTQARNEDPNKEPFPQDEAITNRIETRKRKYDKAKHKGLLQYWTGHLTVKAHNDRVISQQQENLTTRGTNEFKQLYRICMTDADLKERELKAPGYLDGIYILDWTAIGGTAAAEAAPANPKETPKRASGNKVAIQFKYCSHQLDLSKRTFREALKKDNHHVSE